MRCWLTVCARSRVLHRLSQIVYSNNISAANQKTDFGAKGVHFFPKKSPPTGSSTLLDSYKRGIPLWRVFSAWKRDETFRAVFFSLVYRRSNGLFHACSGCDVTTSCVDCCDRNGHITSNVFHCYAMISSLAKVVGLPRVRFFSLILDFGEPPKTCFYGLKLHSVVWPHW